MKDLSLLLIPNQRYWPVLLLTEPNGRIRSGKLTQTRTVAMTTAGIPIIDHLASGVGDPALSDSIRAAPPSATATPVSRYRQRNQNGRTLAFHNLAWGA